MAGQSPHGVSSGISALVEREIERLGIDPVQGPGLWADESTPRDDSRGYAGFQLQMGYALVPEGWSDPDADFKFVDEGLLRSLPNPAKRKGLALRGLELIASLRLSGLCIGLGAVYARGAWTDFTRGFGGERLEDELCWLNLVNAWVHLAIASDRWRDLWVMDILGMPMGRVKDAARRAVNAAPRGARQGLEYCYPFERIELPQTLPGHWQSQLAAVRSSARVAAKARLRRNRLVHDFSARETLALSGLASPCPDSELLTSAFRGECDAGDMLTEVAECYRALRQGGEITFQMLLDRLLEPGIGAG